MDRARAQELLPIITAFAEGKEIQWSAKGKNDWTTIREDARFVIENDYRIKPVYRPYTDCNEMVKDYRKRLAFVAPNLVDLPFIWVQSKAGHSRFLIIGFGDACVVINGASVSLDSLFKEYTYLDGSPIGVIE